MRIPGISRSRAALVVTASAAVVLSTASLAGAASVDDATLVPHSHFVMNPDGSSGVTAKGAAIPNIDSVKSTIRAYYGASSSGIANKTDSPYITEMKAIEDKTLASLPTVDPADNKAVVFDADDTTLWTYDMEDGAMHFNFDPTLQGTWVHQGLFPATPGMVDFVDAVAAKGYHIYGITGRPAAQEDDTIANLKNVGYTEFDNADFFTKFDSTSPQPDYLDCNTGVAPDDATKCSTVEYKAGTRKHIVQDLGQDIVLNVGDQFSDLQGGYADDSLKLPNPTYYLPSPDITGAPATDAQLTPRTSFTMAPDGSSGTTEGGAGIPNIDSVKSTVRNYYAATDPAHPGIANKARSPYISEMTDFAAKWAPKLQASCAKGVAQGIKPAVVFDADDTTLWTYDMEDGAMKFNFDPTLQNTWVQEERFRNVPKMPSVVRAAAKGGCKIIGLTGRNNGQRTATLDNLAKYYYGKDDQSLFKSQYYFTKWTSTDQPPAYVNCALDGNPATCSTVDYKASTRKYVQKHFKFHIIANFGDQFSDLIGGSSDRAVKLPNPTYYLP
jgi:predicted secreted acid phosphatase